MKKKHNQLKPIMFITPALLLVGLIILFPILYTIYISFTNMNIYHWYNFNYIGFQNYINAIFILDSGFLNSLLFTVLWTVVNMVLQLVIAFIISSLLNHKLLNRGRGIYKTLLILPWAIPGYVSILLWKTGMFNTQFGLLNQWLNSAGLESVQWLNSNLIAFICLTIVNLWLALPFMIVIMDGALQSIDKSYYEAADIEGASKFNKAIKITVPLMKVVIAPAVIITIFTTFKQFDIIYLLTQQPGSQTGATLNTIITYAYQNAFITNNYGYSSAVSTIIFIILVSATILWNRRNRGEENA